ncbi:hypothetical protein PR048_001193 [Dryococelus australis]|uniref:Uncharacterized protein n=1 Tax=Dryococelus australis TaxID=614101 RepID=A0ABQ9II09_9NEOP|nr:hypothetical protein PR048_001193 [Dryococelus australis]
MEAELDWTFDELWQLVHDTQATNEFMESHHEAYTEGVLYHCCQAESELQCRATHQQQFHWPGINQAMLHQVSACTQCQTPSYATMMVKRATTVQGTHSTL